MSDISRTTRASAASTWSRCGSPAARETSRPRRRGPASSGCAGPEAADQLEVVLGVDLDVGHARDQVGDLAQHPAGGPARRAERRGELQQRGPLAQGYGDARRPSARVAAVSPDVVPAVGRRGPGGCRGSARRSPRGRPRSRRRTAPRRAAPTVRSSCRRPTRVRPRAAFRRHRLSRRRTAAGTRPCRPGSTIDRAGVLRAHRLVAHQHRADGEHGGEAGAGVQRDGTLAQLGERDRTRPRGRRPRRRPRRRAPTPSSGR